VQLSLPIKKQVTGNGSHEERQDTDIDS